MSNFQKSRNPDLQRSGLGLWFELLETHPMKLFWSNLLTFAFLLPCLVAAFFLINLWDWLSIAAVWLFYSLAGPAVTALHFICIQIARGRPVWIKEDYWSCFKNEWKKAILLSAVVGGLWLGYIVWIRWIILANGGVELFAMLLFVCGGFLLAGFSALSYQQLAMVELPFANVLKNAVLLIFAGKIRSFAAVMFSMLCIGLCLYFYSFSVFVLILGFCALGIMTLNLIFLPVFNEFFPDSREDEP